MHQAAPVVIWHHASMQRLIVVALTVAAVALGIVIARNRPSADQQALDFRQALMTVIDGVSAPLFRIQRGQQSYDDALVSRHAMQLATLGGMVSEAFARDTHNAHLQSGALPYVWSDPGAFATATGRMQQATAALQQSVAGHDRAQIERAIQVLAGSCAQCHRQFRANE